MNKIAFVPARGGSRSIPMKNIKDFCGRPLIYWVLNELQQSVIDQIIVATDSDDIINIVNSFGFSKVKIYDRDPLNAQDNSSTESVMLEYIDQSNLCDIDIFMLVQLTTPFTQAIHFNEGLNLFNKYDSILSCANSSKFMWSEEGVALNYDIYNRPRRQDFDNGLIENGAFYINSIKNIKSNKNRISGNVGVYKMPEYTSVEIDEPLDWIIAEYIMNRHVLHLSKNNFSNIKILLSDVDGVLTDGGMYYTEKGEEFKKFCTYDGMGLQMMQKKGVRVGILTSEDIDINRNRAIKLGLDFDFHGVKDKLSFVKDLCNKEGVLLSEIAYIGDDINCYHLLSHVGIAACPSNAIDKVKSIPNILQLKKKGGEGVVREFVELFL